MGNVTDGDGSVGMKWCIVWAIRRATWGEMDASRVMMVHAINRGTHGGFPPSYIHSHKGVDSPQRPLYIVHQDTPPSEGGVTTVVAVSHGQIIHRSPTQTPRLCIISYLMAGCCSTPRCTDPPAEETTVELAWPPPTEGATASGVVFWLYS